MVVLSLVAIAGLSLAIYMAWLFHDMPNASELVDYHPPTATRVYAWDGTLIGEYSTERRIYVPFDQIPPQVYDAFLAAEDHNFFNHGGVDVGGVGRAMFKDVFNILQGRRPEGGSTITQQVAKTVLLTNEQTLSRKMKEAILATRLEQALTKKQILELYLNEIWLGHDSYGVGAAAYNYFGKSLSDLSLAQCAFLASLPKGPDNYNPARHMQAALQRRNSILEAMLQLGTASAPDVQAALQEPIVIQPPQRASYHDADYFVEEVRRQALAQFGDKVNQGGYYIRTTLDPRLQTAARIALMDGLETYDHRHGWRGAWGKVAIEPGWEKAAMTHSPPSERKKWVVGVVEEASGGQVKVKVAADDSEGYILPADVSWARAGKGGLNVGDLIFVEPADGGGLHLRQVPIVNGAMVAMDPNTGRVLAMVGGYSFSLSNFNRATQAWRQPGSSFKPFVYATALENGFTPASIVSAGPITLPGANGVPWTPENYEKNFPGPLIFRRGLELSLNTMTVRIAAQVGMPKIVANAVKFGVVPKMDPVLSMALGSGETTPFRITSAYSAFLNGGRKINPHLVELVEDRDGKTIFRSDARECRDCNRDFTGDDGPRLRAGRPAGGRSDHGLPDRHHAAGRSAARHRDPGAGAELAGRRQDRHHQRVPQRLVHRLHAADRGRHLRRLRRQPLARPWRDRRGRLGADLHRVHEGGAQGHAEAGFRPAARDGVRPGRPQPRGLPARHPAVRPDCFAGAGRRRPRRAGHAVQSRRRAAAAAGTDRGAPRRAGRPNRRANSTDCSSAQRRLSARPARIP